MRFLLTGLLVLGLSGFAARADEKPLTVKQSLDELKKELAEAQKKHGLDLQKAQKAIREAKDDQKAEAQKKLAAVQADAPAPVYAVKFLELAEKNPTDPAALGAIRMAWETAKVESKDGPATPQQKTAIRIKVLTFLQAHWVEKPAIRGVLPMVANPNDALSSQLLVNVMARNPERKVQALACKVLGKAVEKSNPKLSEELTKALHEKYGDIYPDLSVGKMAPEVISHNADGKEVKLSDLHGKVVVLDIWATWCPHCRAMIPHEREMIERYKDKPFAIVSISFDDEKKTLTDFLKKEKMPWRQWWHGTSCGIAMDDSWDIEYFPTVIVLGPKGVIRDKGVNGEDLDKAVEKLLKEMEKKK